MRVFSLVLALVLAFGTAAFAQNRGGGVKAGLNFTDVNLSGAETEGAETNRRTGFIGGVFFQLPVAPQVSIQFEGLYAQKGANFDDPESAEEGKLKLDYFEVPVLVRWDSPTGANAQFNLFAGPSFNFNTRARFKEPGSEEEDLKEDVEDVDVGLVVGAGVEVGRFLIDGRYHHGLREVNKNAEAEDFKIKHRAFSVMVGFRF